jgi:hypothetical protein
VTCPEDCLGKQSGPGWAPCLPGQRQDSQSSPASPVAAHKLLAETQKVRFRAFSTCMYPGVRPGDVLCVKPKTVREIQPGEAAVFHRHGQLVGHRTIAKGEDGRGAFILTRPDRAAEGDDGPSYDDDVVGVIDRIKRRGRTLAPERTSPGLPARMWHALVLRGIEARTRAMPRVLTAVSLLQRPPVYRFFARSWFAQDIRRLSLAAYLPAGSSLPFLRRITGAELARLDLGAEERQTDDWSLALQSGGRPAVTMRFVRRPAGCPYEGWWVGGVSTRVRYRGLGLERMLLGKAREILGRSGAAPRVAIPETPGEDRRLGKELSMALAEGRGDGRLVRE